MLVNLYDVAVVQDVIAFDRLAGKDSGSPDACRLEALLQIAVDDPRQFIDGAADRAGEGSRFVCRLAGLLGVNAENAKKLIQGRAQFLEPLAGLTRNRDDWPAPVDVLVQQLEPLGGVGIVGVCGRH